MSWQPDLLPPSGLAVKPEPGRREPRFWVRRLVIWGAPGTIIREIGLRPGLNILWSPDPADGGGNAETESAFGHGSGKTLFCRLLRYVLGEERFSSDDQRFRIARALPAGMVGAEVMIDGTGFPLKPGQSLTSMGYAQPGGGTSSVREVPPSG